MAFCLPQFSLIPLFRYIGGVNAKQIGLGVTTGATSIAITTAGAAETTGNPFDLKLTDSQTTNFFIVSDGEAEIVYDTIFPEIVRLL